MKIGMVFILCAFFLLPGVCCTKGQAPVFDGDKAFEYLVKQVDFGPRNPGSEGHAACLAWLVKELEKSADKVVKQPFMFQDSRTRERHRLHNVIASFGGQGRRIMLCAHWDTRPIADFDPDPAKRNTPILGANDGASGVAVLLEIARHLKENPPPVGVDIVLFDGEDSGVEGNPDTWCYGSRYFAQNKQASYLPEFAVLVDMVGKKNAVFPYEGFSWQYAPQLVDKVWRVAESLGYTAFERRIGQDIIDDHLELLKAGIPAINIIDFDYPYWHTTEDTPDKCSPESLKTVGQVLLHLIYE